MARLKEAGAESDKILAAANKELELLKIRSPDGSPTAPRRETNPRGTRPIETGFWPQVSKDETEIARLKDAVTDAEKIWPRPTASWTP